MNEEAVYKRLIRKFLSGEISCSEIDILKEWLSQSHENRKVFDIENELWNKTNYKNEIENYDVNLGWEEVSNELFLKRPPKKVFTLNNKKYYTLVAAASISILIAVGGITLWLSERTQKKQILATAITIKTSDGEKASIVLADSTKVIINSGSSLQYDASYNLKDRKIKLSGEAFFDVHTDKDKPFVVQVDGIEVYALGTRFNIYSYLDDSRTETTLEEGKLRILLRDKETIDVNPGQQVIYKSKTDETIVKDVVPEIYSSWTENKLRFIDTPFEEVLRRLERRYNVTFEIRNQDLLELKYTATFIDESIEDVMAMLETISPISYKIYNRTRSDDQHYLKPKIEVDKRN